MIDFGGISYSTLPTVDDTTSSAISIGSSRFRFGSTTPSSVYVRIYTLIASVSVCVCGISIIYTLNCVLELGNLNRAV